MSTADFVVSCGGSVERALERLRENIEALGGAGADKAVMAAMKKTLRELKKEAGRTARDAYTYYRKNGMFSDADILLASRGSRSQGMLALKGNIGESLIHFHPQPGIPNAGEKILRPREGVSIMIKKSGSKRYVPIKKGFGRPFIMKKKQGGYGVFAAKEGAGRESFRGQSKRKKGFFWKSEVQMLFGPSPIQAVGREDNAKRLIDFAEWRYEMVLKEELEKQIEKLFSRSSR